MHLEESRPCPCKDCAAGLRLAVPTPAPLLPFNNSQSEYLIGKVEGAEPPFKPGGCKQAKQEGQAAPKTEAAGEEGKEDEPALQKGKVLKVSG